MKNWAVPKRTVWCCEPIRIYGAEYLAGTIYGEDKDGNKLNPSDFGGACNLGSLFLHNFVVNPFTKDANIDYNKLKDTIFVATRMLDNIIDINKFPDEIYENYQKSFRTIGLGITGLADMLAMLNIKYNSKEALVLSSKLMNFISLNTYKASIMLAKEKGEFPLLNRQEFVKSGFIQKHCKNNELSNEWLAVVEDILRYGIRNSKMISIAPTGTLSLTFGNNCSSGLEPIFSLEYERKVKIGGQSDDNIKIVPMRDYAYGRWLEVKDSEDCNVKEDVFITTLEMTVDEHVDMLSSLAYHVDMSCSKTINVPSEYSFDDTKKIYEKCHLLGIKGCTIFRPNEIRQGILISETKESSNDETKHCDYKCESCDCNCTSCDCNSSDLPRGYVIDVSEDLVGYKRKLMTGCGGLHFEVYYDEHTGLPQETFLNVGSGGGCERNYQFISRLMSLALRAGVSLDDIIDQAMSIRPCTSYINRTKSKGDTSQGTSCPSAIGNALKDLKKKMPNVLATERKYIEKNNTRLDVKKPKETQNKNTNGARCPECGEDIVFEGGCNVCKYCGWSKCS